MPLAAVLNHSQLSRPQVVKHLWEYIKGNELQNPSNKREIMCDDGLRGVFGCDKIDMFRMNKVLGMYVPSVFIAFFVLVRIIFLLDCNGPMLTLFLFFLCSRHLHENGE